MGLQKIKNEDLNREQKIIETLYDYCEKMQSCVFNSGAGSGKTYALVECLKYIIVHNRENLKRHHQKVICITYTNVAANNIKQKIGLTDVAEISTIHDRMWEVIKDQKQALLKLHKEKLETELKYIDNFLSENQEYSSLDLSEKEEFLGKMKREKERYNKAYDQKADGFRQAIKAVIGDFPLLKNVSKFKKVVDSLFRKERYEQCLKKIEQGEYKAVRYDAMYNKDRLDIMRISHDTLLEYSFMLVDKYPQMCRILLDSYPYILIDEYQDTSPVVVKIMNKIQTYSKNTHRPVFIAYFGDSIQNIYEDGVGGKLKDFHPDLIEVKKEYNRRSYQEIIDVANSIRKDDIKQESIYQDCTGGEVEFYGGAKEDIDVFIQQKKTEWEINKENPLHCLFSTNEQVAKYSEFYPLYDIMKKAKIYKNSNYTQINSELLSHDLKKLGDATLLLYRIMDLIIKVNTPKMGIYEILTEEERKISLKELREIIKKLQSIKGNNSEREEVSTLETVLNTLIEMHNSTSIKILKCIIKRVLDVEEDEKKNFSLSLIRRKMMRMLSDRYYKNKNENEDEETVELVNQLLGLDVSVLENWYFYIIGSGKKEINYHTFHSTKGLEYRNVLVILESGFGRKKDIFKNFLKNIDKMEMVEECDEARNLLYVVVTRAIQKLAILYVDDMEEIKEQVEKVFGKVKEVSESSIFMVDKI